MSLNLQRAVLRVLTEVAPEDRTGLLDELALLLLDLFEVGSVLGDLLVLARDVDGQGVLVLAVEDHLSGTRRRSLDGLLFEVGRDGRRPFEEFLLDLFKPLDLLAKGSAASSRHSASVIARVSSTSLPISDSLMYL